MFRSGRSNRCTSANMRRCRENKLHVVELTLSDVGPVNISPQGKFGYTDACIRQQESWRRPGTGLAEVFIDEVGTIPHYPSDNALNVEGDNYDGHSHSANISNNQKKTFGNSRYQVAPESDSSNRSVRPYRPISSHQYLTSTELKDSTINDKNVHLGRPTRTTLLRDRQRRRSVPAADVTHHLQQKAGQKVDPRTPTRYETVKTILSSMIPPGQSLHSFLSGARYNRSNWIETIGSLDLASDQPALSGSSLNTPHQRQRIMSEQLDVDYTPKAPPESPVDFNNTDGCTGAFLPALSGSGTTAAEPSSPLQKQLPTESRSRKIAWEEEIKRLSPLPDRAASTQEKVRFQLEEPGGISHATHHERTQHTARPSSVRTPVAQVVKPGRDMAAVVIHGIALHGAPSARDVGVPHAEQVQDGMRRSWSATTYAASGARPPLIEFNRLDSLKVTGVRVSGAMDTGRAGLRLSALKPWRLENDAESTEALVGSRCEGYSEREVVVAGGVENGVVVSDRSSSNVEADRQINFNEDVDNEIDSNEDTDRVINSAEDIDHQINSDEAVDNMSKSSKAINSDFDSGNDFDHEINNSSNEVDRKIVVNKETIRNKRNNSSKTDSEATYTGILEGDHGKSTSSSIHLGCLSPDQLLDTNGYIGGDRDDLDVESIERVQANLAKPDRVNSSNESKEKSDVAITRVGRVNIDDMHEELGQFNLHNEAAERGQEGRIRIGNESAKREGVFDGRSQASDEGRNSIEEGKEKEQDVVFFITEESLNNLEKLVTKDKDDMVTKNNDDMVTKDNDDMVTNYDDDMVYKDEEKSVAEDEGDDEENLRSGTQRKDMAVTSPNGGTTEAAGHWSAGRRD